MIAVFAVFAVLVNLDFVQHYQTAKLDFVDCKVNSDRVVNMVKMDWTEMVNELADVDYLFAIAANLFVVELLVLMMVAFDVAAKRKVTAKANAVVVVE